MRHPSVAILPLASLYITLISLALFGTCVSTFETHNTCQCSFVDDEYRRGQSSSPWDPLHVLETERSIRGTGNGEDAPLPHSSEQQPAPDIDPDKDRTTVEGEIQEDKKSSEEIAGRREPSSVVLDSLPVGLPQHNFASALDGAKPLAANPAAKKVADMLDEDSDTFMRNDCKDDKWVVLELSQVARVSRIELSQNELYSSRVKEFEVSGRQSHPRTDNVETAKGLNSTSWRLVGRFMAENIKGDQTFNIEHPVWVRYLLIRFLTHYGNEPVCAINSFAVFGRSAAEELEEQLAGVDVEVDLQQSLSSESTDDASRGLFESDTVLNGAQDPSMPSDSQIVEDAQTVKQPVDDTQGSGGGENKTSEQKRDFATGASGTGAEDDDQLKGRRPRTTIDGVDSIEVNESADGASSTKTTMESSKPLGGSRQDLPRTTSSLGVSSGVDTDFRPEETNVESVSVSSSKDSSSSKSVDGNRTVAAPTTESNIASGMASTKEAHPTKENSHGVHTELKKPTISEESDSVESKHGNSFDENASSRGHIASVKSNAQGGNNASLPLSRQQAHGAVPESSQQQQQGLGTDTNGNGMDVTLETLPSMLEPLQEVPVLKPNSGSSSIYDMLIHELRSAKAQQKLLVKAIDAINKNMTSMSATLRALDVEHEIAEEFLDARINHIVDIKVEHILREISSLKNTVRSVDKGRHAALCVVAMIGGMVMVHFPHMNDTSKLLRVTVTALALINGLVALALHVQGIQGNLFADFENIISRLQIP